MNAIRQIVVPDSAGTVQVNLPPEFAQKPVEIIAMPLDSEATGVDLLTIMDYIGFKAAQRGLTPDILADLLRDE